MVHDEDAEVSIRLATLIANSLHPRPAIPHQEAYPPQSLTAPQTAGELSLAHLDAPVNQNAAGCLDALWTAA